MWLIHRSKRCVELDDRVFSRLLSFYPEEDLLSRPKLAAALATGEISKTSLQSEADTLFIPWQMFLLSWENLQRQLRRIETERSDKIGIGQVATRPGAGGATPYRLIDRYIRAQHFLRQLGSHTRNRFAGSLRGKSVLDAVATISDHFEIDRAVLWNKPTKEAAFDYLVERIESGQINVARGTAESRLVPTSRNHRALYKNISGFCLKDSRVPFAFVQMSMGDEEEPAGRRIYTLLLLTALIGLDTYAITRDWRPGRTKRSRTYPIHAHDIASEFLFPTAELAAFKGQPFSADLIHEIAERFKLTPSAVAFRLWKARFISIEERDSLMGTAGLPAARGRSARIDRAVTKLNGGLVVSTVNAAFSEKRITPNQAQYVLFGRIRRLLWRKYRAVTGL